MTLKIIEIVAVTGAFTGCAYYVLCIWSAAKYVERSRIKPAPDCPPFSILKPLKGADPEMYESFRSHCMQDYPQYEIIFGVSERDDPAAEFVERLQREFPRIPISLIVCEQVLGNNIKVSNLAQMLPRASHEYLIVNDSDIRVPLDYLGSLASALCETKVGLATCLYRGVAAKTLGSRLESLGIGTDFMPGVLTARLLEGGITFGLGSTLAFRRADLAAIGGFESIVDYLADDYELGNRIAKLGRRIEIADAVVETHLPPYSMKGFVDHQLRWARTIRDSRPGGYFGLIFTFGLPWAALAVVASKGAPWVWALFALSLALRAIMAWIVSERVLQDSKGLRWLWLLPLRDFLGALIWLASFSGHTIKWRGDTFELKHGRLVRANS